MSNEYTETGAYKHLLSVCENMLYSVDVDEKILSKYQELKSSVLGKIVHNSTQSSNSSKQASNQHYINLLGTYRAIIENAIKIIGSFEEQLQVDMERTQYNETILKLNKEVDKKLSGLYTGSSQGKMKLLHEEEINTLKYQFDQLDAKFQNMGLLIEVHKKMHEIIIDATNAEKKRISVEQAFKTKIKDLEFKLKAVGDVEHFLSQFNMTQEKYREYKIASKKLTKVLFSQ